MVTIRVGCPPTDFIIHEEILKSATESRFFQVAFTNGFKETETGALELPEDDAQAVQVLLNWIYGTVMGFVDCDKTGFFETLDAFNLVKLYVLACRYTLNVLHDALITYLWNKSCSTCWLSMGLNGEILSYLEANTINDCPLNNLLVAWMADDALQAKSAPLGDLHSTFEAIPEQMLRAAFLQINRAKLLPAKINAWGAYTPSKFYRQKRPLCYYHCHDEDQPCPAPGHMGGWANECPVWGDEDESQAS